MPCPLPLSFANITGNFSLVEVPKEEAQLQVETEAAALCTPSYFTLNSQVPTGQDGGGGPRGSRGGCPDMVPVSPQTAYTIPIMAFAFVCHPEVLPIYTELKEWVSVVERGAGTLSWFWEKQCGPDRTGWGVGSDRR